MEAQIEIQKFKSGDKVIFSEHSTIKWTKRLQSIYDVIEQNCVDVTKEISPYPLYYKIRITGIKK
jgi:hypothetical protein